MLLGSKLFIMPLLEDAKNLYASTILIKYEKVKDIDKSMERHCGAVVRVLD